MSRQVVELTVQAESPERQFFSWENLGEMAEGNTTEFFGLTRANWEALSPQEFQRTMINLLVSGDLKGDKGDDGREGPSGADDADGCDGQNGVNGQDGRDGAPGKPGGIPILPAGSPV